MVKKLTMHAGHRCSTQYHNFKKETIYHAALLDPQTACELNLDQILKMVDELLDAHGSMLPAFK